MPIGFRPLDLIVVFVIALLIFGPKKLPELSRGIAQSIQQMKKGLNDLKGPHGEDLAEQEAQQALARARVENARLELEALERDIASKRATVTAYEVTQPEFSMHETEQTGLHVPETTQTETITHEVEQAVPVDHQ